MSNRVLKFQRPVYLLGGHLTSFIGKGAASFVHPKHPDFGKRENPTLEDFVGQAVNGALADSARRANCDVNWLAGQVQTAYVGNFVGELFSSQGHLGAALAGSHPALQHVAASRVEGACASGGLAFAAAARDIQGGADFALCAGAEVQTTASAREGAGYLARAAHFARQRGIDEFTFPALFARRMRAYRDQHDADPALFARVAAKAYVGAALNPLAHMHARARKMLGEELSQSLVGSPDAQAAAVDAIADQFAKTDEAGRKSNPHFLGNQELSPFLRVSDCSQVSDGGAGALLVSEAGLQALGLSPADAGVEVATVQTATGSLYEELEAPAQLVSMSTSATAVGRAYEAAGVGPADVGVVELHDCFSVAEVLMTEAAGFAAAGQGAALIASGQTALWTHNQLAGAGGGSPAAPVVNSGGGLIGFGHPVGATGIKQILEVARQMRGECGDYQMARPPTVGLTINMGGDDRTTVAAVLKKM